MMGKFIFVFLNQDLLVANLNTIIILVSGFRAEKRFDPGNSQKIFFNNR